MCDFTFLRWPIISSFSKVTTQQQRFLPTLFSDIVKDAAVRLVVQCAMIKKRPVLRMRTI